MAQVQDSLSQTMEQMAKEVNLAIKTLKEGTLPTPEPDPEPEPEPEPTTDSSDSGGESNAESG